MPLLLALGFVGGLWAAHRSPLGTPTTDPPPSPAAELSAPPGRALADQFSQAFEAAAGKVSPAVVPIFAEQVVAAQNPFGSPGDFFQQFFGDDFFRRFYRTPQGEEGEGETQTVRSLGSGVVVTPDGYILTNNHVVEGAEKVTVALSDKKRFPAKVVGTDPQTDVAVIKIDADDLQAASLGDSDQVKVGQWVIAIGNPFELLHTVTAGIISAKGRSSVGLADYEDFIQTDTSINPGNSGGALADLSGNVLGINTAISSPSGGNVGIGFAIPINMARRVMDELIAHGKVTRGYLALVPQDIDERLARALKLPDSSGALVADVIPGGPADRAGVHRGDVIRQFNGARVEGSLELGKQVAQARPGDSASLTLPRDGKAIKVTPVLGERPKGRGGRVQPDKPEADSGRRLGLSVQDLTPDLARQLGYANEKGVLVADVAPGSPADDAGIERGDLIQEFNRAPMASVRDLSEALSRLQSGASAAVLLRRGSSAFFVALQTP